GDPHRRLEDRVSDVVDRHRGQKAGQPPGAAPGASQPNKSWQEVNRSYDNARVARLEITDEARARGVTADNMIESLGSKGIKAEKVNKGGLEFVEVQPESMQAFHDWRHNQAAHQQGGLRPGQPRGFPIDDLMTQPWQAQPGEVKKYTLQIPE